MELENLIDKQAKRLIEKLQKENEELKALISSDMRDTAGKLLALQEENAELKKIKSQLQQQAEIHAQEARTQRSTVHEIYQELGIQKGDWNGKVPVVQKFDELKATVNALRDQSVYLFNVGYGCGHHDTVEGGYVDIHYSEMKEYHTEDVEELLEDEGIKTLAQHLAEHDAKVVETLRVALMDNYEDIESQELNRVYDFVWRYAQQLREQEK